ncbi:MAG: hypothetical protein DMF14_10060 [Verrucomicrobia bacterium]|nr:MAG: hypothetical protein DMF14_10060 [Verrucomicrobiota bacterium]
MTGLSRPETAMQMRTSHQQQRLKKRRCGPLPTKPDSRRARPPTRAFFLGEQEIFVRPGRSSVRRSSSILSFLPRIGFAPRQLGDLHGARDDFDRCITLGTDLPLAYGNRAEVELMLGDDSAAAADLAQAQSLAATMSDPPPASSTPSARKNQTHHKTSRTGTSNNGKGTTR